MTDFLQYFETEKQYNDHQENNLNYFNTISYIEETDTVKYNNTLFPFYFESDGPSFKYHVEVSPSVWYAEYTITPHVNLYNTLGELFEVLFGPRTNYFMTLPEEFLNLCSFYVNGNKVIRIDKFNDEISLEFEDINWAPIDGWEFAQTMLDDYMPIGIMQSDGTIKIKRGIQST